MKKAGITKPSGLLLKDAIFGVNDGVVSMLALAAGLIAASLPNKVIIIAGLAEAFTGAISMAIGSYISTKSKVEFLQRELLHETRQVDKKPFLEKQHLTDIYRQRGLTGKKLQMIVETIISNKKVWKDVMQREELGFTSHVLEDPLKGAMVMFFTFLISSFVPLLPFFWATSLFISFPLSIFNGLVLLFLVGIGKTYFTGRNRIRSGIEMVVVGSLATLLAYGIGHYVNSFV